MFDSFLQVVLGLFSSPVASAEPLDGAQWKDKTPVEIEEQIGFPSKNELLQVSDTTLYWVVAVLDGDTILVSAPDRSIFQVRLLAVDTNEINGPDSTAECYGIEAANFTMNFLKNRAVYLSADPANKDTDPFGRKLRYVDVLSEDGTVARLNEALLKGGIASYPSEYPTSTPDYFQSLEDSAKANQLGQWGACE
jgi:endonuclease YncB( thermonuclease family)